MKRSSLLIATFLILGISTVASQNKMANSTRLTIKYISKDFSIDRLNDAAWKRTSQNVTTKYWSGKSAPAGRQFKAKLLWSDKFLYVRFDASQGEPLIVSDKPDLTKKTKGLWDRDVCEIFIATNKALRNKYFEFEIAPTGEWIDLAIDLTSGKRETDWDYASGMQSAAKIEKGKVVMAIKINWKAFGRTPKAGDIWLGNLFRCVGKDPIRGYLSWQATNTIEPNFHVPERFGEFEFTK